MKLDNYWRKCIMFQIPMFSFRQKNVKIEQAEKEILKSKYTIPKQKFLLNILSSSQKIVPYHHELCLPVLEIHINGIRRNAIFCVRLPSLNITFLRFSHVYIVKLTSHCWAVFMYVNISYFAFLLFREWTLCVSLFESMFLLLLEYHLEVEFLGNRVDIVDFLRALNSFSCIILYSH